jgi:two-component system, OmpR family, response regulator ChvI
MASILLVDDDELALASWCAALSTNHQLVAVHDGLEAWERLQTVPIDAVIADLRMPRMSGGVLCEKIRENPRFAKLPVVLVSGELSPPAFVRYDSYLRKPVSIEQLRDTIERLLSRTSPLRRAF